MRLGFLLLWLLPGVVGAQESPRRPLAAASSTQDWIRLKSGEWLMGELHLLRDGDLEFESDVLEDLTLDFDDVVEIRPGRVLTLVFNNGHAAIGRVAMQDSLIRVHAGGDSTEYRRRDLLSILEGEPDEWNFWSLELSLGTVARVGNTDQSDFNAIVLLRREAERNRLALNYTGNFGELEGTENVNNHLFVARFDLFFSHRTFITPLSADFYADEFQNIRSRWTLGAGVGYYFIRKDGLEWRVGLGGGYRITRYRSVQAGEQERSESGAVTPSVEFLWEPKKAFDLNVSYSVQIGVPDVEETFHHFQTLFGLEVYDPLEFTISFTWDRVETPQADADGNVSERDDLRTAIGLGLEY